MTLWIDIETYSEEELKYAGLYRYAQSPSFEVDLFGYAYDDDPVTVIDLTNPFGDIPEQVKKDLMDPTVVKAATNAAFEWYCLSQHFGLSDKETREWLPQWFDVQLQFLYAGLPAKLAIVSDALGLPEDKAKKSTGTALITYFAKPCKPTKANGGRTRNHPWHNPEKWEKYKEYNASDVESERELYKRLAHWKIPPFVLQEWVLDNLMNLDGVAVDLQLVDAAIKVNDEIVAEGKERMRQLTGLSNPGSGEQLLAWLNGTQHIVKPKPLRVYKKGVVATHDPSCEEKEKASTGVTRVYDAREYKAWQDEVAAAIPKAVKMGNLQKETVAGVIDMLEDPENGQRTPSEDLALEVLKLHAKVNRASVKKYYAIRKAVCKDGRVRGCFAFYGASRTGREAGRIVQLQNLAKNFLKDLDGARSIAKTGDAKLMKLIYADPQSVLSQLIRTAFIPKEGHKFVDYDFHAIEAVVQAWVSGEEWRMEVFRTHGLIYEMSAAQMFGVPFDTIVKGHENYRYRARGKVAELALGYAGGENALTKMDFNNELDDDEKIPIRDAWRKASPKIVETWREYEDAAKHVIQFGGKKKAKKVEFALEYGSNPNSPYFMTILLPSGRKLLYMNPRLIPGQYGPQIAFDGLIPNTSKFGEVTTFGGRLFENCCAYDTRTFTDSGWKPLGEVTPRDRLWDGQQWVSHSGLVAKGEQQTVSLNGVRCTAEHKVLTVEKGWVCAEQTKGLHWCDVQLPDGFTAEWMYGKKPKTRLGRTMQMWKHNTLNKLRNIKAKTKELWIRNEPTYKGGKDKSWDVSPPRICSVSGYAGQMQSSNSPSVEQLRGSRDKRLCKVERKFSKLLGRHAGRVQTRPNAGTDRRKYGLFPGELQVGNSESAGEEQTEQHTYSHTMGGKNRSRSVGAVRDRDYNVALQAEKRRSTREVVHSPGRKEPVYDLLNCGPNHCFTVMSDCGPVLVHNCVQAIARDCLFVSIRRLHEKGQSIVMSIHDEHVQEALIEEVDKVKETTYNIMREPIPWAPDLPLTSDGWAGDFYRKE